MKMEQGIELELLRRLLNEVTEYSDDYTPVVMQAGGSEYPVNGISVEGNKLVLVTKTA